MQVLRFYRRTIVVFLCIGLICIGNWAYTIYEQALKQPQIVRLAAKRVLLPPKAHPDYTLPPIQEGRVPVILSIPTGQPVVFLTIDDGAVQKPEMIRMLTNYRATLFLNDIHSKENPSFFRTLQYQGKVIEDHTVNHLDLAALSYTEQKAEICDNADAMAMQFGHRPTLLRPPFGSYNDDTRRAAADCGMKALIQWHAKVNNGSVQYQDGDHLLPGDIVLMHFRNEFAADFKAFEAAAKASGLHTELLEDWLR